MAKLGRPKKPKAERRGKPLRVLLTDAEREALEAGSAGRGLNVSTWARMILLEAAGKERNNIGRG
jgi:hypothetical protein